MFEQYFDPDLVKKPAFDITIGGKQVLSLNGRMMGLTLTDNRGFEADTLEITIDDADGKIELPPRGVEISVAIGWRGEPLTHKGVFTVDEVRVRLTSLSLLRGQQISGRTSTLSGNIAGMISKSGKWSVPLPGAIT